MGLMGFLAGDNVRVKSTGRMAAVQESNGHAVKVGEELVVRSHMAVGQNRVPKKPYWLKEK